MTDDKLKAGKAAAAVSKATGIGDTRKDFCPMCNTITTQVNIHGHWNCQVCLFHVQGCCDD